MAIKRKKTNKHEMKMKKKICFVSLGSAPLFSSNEELKYVGGAEIKQVLIAKELAKRGFNISFITYDEELKKKKEFNDIEIIKTAGDRVTSAPFAQVGSMGIFVKEIESALADKRADLAVHSLKDLQTELRPGLRIGAVTERGSARDAMISRDGSMFDDLMQGSIIGTSSARRRGLIAAEGRGLKTRECRGNLPTRIEKLRKGEFDAIILAEGGLQRMGMTAVITECLDLYRFIPAVGQGALGIEIRDDDEHMAELVKPLNHEPTYAACMEERRFLAEIGGGCHAPVGGHMYYQGGDAIFLAFVGTSDGSWFARRMLTVPAEEASGLGERMAMEIKALPGSEAFSEEVTRDAS